MCADPAVVRGSPTDRFVFLHYGKEKVMNDLKRVGRPALALLVAFLAAWSFVSASAAEEPAEDMSAPVRAAAILQSIVSDETDQTAADAARILSGLWAHSFAITAAEGGDIPAGLDGFINGAYHPGTVISIAVRSMPGYRFVEWRSSGGGSFADAHNAQTQFTMPAENVVITACCEPLASESTEAAGEGQE